jgi:poly(3-hydroxybutyrate) depolymerase
MRLSRRRSVPSLTVLVGLGVAACTSIIGLPDLPDAPSPSGQGGGGGTTAGTGSGLGGSGLGGSGAAASGGASGAAATSTGGSAARGGGTSGDAGESAGGDATSSGAGNLPDTGGASAVGGSSPRGGAQGDGGSGNAGTGGGGSAGRGTGGASSGAGGTGGSAGAGAGTSGAAGAAGASTGSTGCNKDPGISSDSYNNGQHIAIDAAGLQRRYILNVPSNYDMKHPYRLVVAFHWINSTDDDVYAGEYYHLLPLGSDNTIFVAPNGQASGNGCTQASGCGWANPNNSDLLLVDAIVAQLEDSFCIDKSRIIVTGWSYGASMAYKTACERPLGSSGGYVRAAAIYSGVQGSGTCTPSRPVAYYASHGLADTVVPYSTGIDLATRFASPNGCSWMSPNTLKTTDPHECVDSTGCDAGYPLKFCAFYGEHTADPIDPQQSTSWEYQTAWDFLSQF